MSLQGSLNPRNHGGGPKIDIKQLQSMECAKCDCKAFSQAYLLKKMSAIQSPTGEEEIVPVQVFACNDCGFVPEVFTQQIGPN